MASNVDTFPRLISVSLFIWLLAFSILSVFAQGIVFPSGNNVFHLPILLDYAASSEGPHDAFSLSSEHFVNHFWVVLGAITNEENIKSVFAITQILLRFLTLIAIFFLVSTLRAGTISFRSIELAVFCVGLLPFFPLFEGESTLGRNWQFPNALSHSAAVVPVACISLAFILRGHFLAAASVVGVAFNLNAFVGVWIGLCAGIVCIWQMRQSSPRAIAARALSMIALFCLFAAPTIWWILNTVMTPLVESAPAFDFRDYLRTYYGLHTFVDLQKPRFASVIFACVCACPAVIVMARGLSDGRSTRCCALPLSLVAILLLGAALPYLTSERLLLTLYPLRMDTYLCLLFAALAIAFLCADPMWRHLAGWQLAKPI